MLCAASPAAGHGFGQRFDLPLPLPLWIAGAGATIVLTFAAVAFFARSRSASAGYPRVVLLRRAPAAWIAAVRIAAVALFVLTLCAGFFGAQDPYRNLAVTMVWVIWWVGLAFVCALVGDLWALANPLAALHAWAGSPSLGLAYPERLGAWPAVALFFAFAWMELVWPANDVPAYLACAMLAYATLAWAGMALYGRDAWLKNAEAFSLAFGVLARLAPLRWNGRELELRPPGAGLAAAEPVPVPVLAFVLLMLASVSFDGFLETPLMERVFLVAIRLGFEDAQLVATAAFAAFALGFLAAFWLASWAMVRAAGGGPTVREAACAFVLTLVPIAVAYHLAHYFSLLLTAGQFIIPLGSDPFGFGWDLFGTARYRVDLGIVSPYVFWYGAVTLIVAGHVIAVLAAHGTALRVFGGRRRALASQIPMVALMVAYTMLSLWILAQPIVG